MVKFANRKPDNRYL